MSRPCRPALLPLTAAFLMAACQSSAEPSPATQVSPVTPRHDAATLAESGIISVLDYGADPTGASLSTSAFAAALAAADADQMAILVPTGTYLIDDTLLMHKTDVTGRSGSAIIGSTTGARPVIRLRNAAAGFGTATWAGSKPMVHVISECNTSAPNLCETEYGRGNFVGNNFSQMIRNIHFDCGANNPGCVGVRFAAAQWATLEDASFDLRGSGPGDEAFCGVYDPPAAGWGTVNVTVTGGRYGIRVESSSGSTLVGTRLLDQTVESLVMRGGLPLTLVGFEITKDSGPVLVDDDGYRWDVGTRAVNLIDGTVTLQNGGTAFDNNAGRNLHLRNVYVTGAGTLIQSGAEAAITPAGTWSRIEEYAYADRDTANVGNYKESQVVIDGVVSPIETSTVSTGTPPADLSSRHGWTKHPGFEDPGVCNVIDPPYNAAGDGVTDDRAAIQAAIDACQTVFVPKGNFMVGGTLTLAADTVMFGLQRHTTRIAHLRSWAPTAEIPIIETVDDPNATTWLSTLAIRTYKDVPVANDFFTTLHWRAGRRSMVSGVTPFRHTWTDPTVAANREANDHSQVKITGSGGGRWYFLGNEDRMRSEHPNYHQLEVVNTTEPLSFYGMNPEKTSGDVAWLFNGASNIRMYGSKTEPVLTGWRFESVDNVAFFGWGANTRPPTGRAGFEVVDSTNILLTNLCERGVGEGREIMSETVGGNRTVWADANQAIALFKRGNPDDSVMDHGTAGAANTPPNVSAGSDDAITWPTADYALQGTATDADGPNALAIAWSQVSGPGTASFSDSTSPTATVTFSAPGYYVLRLTVGDGEATVFDDVAITVFAETQGDATAPKLATAPTIDGAADPGWSTAVQNPVSNVIDGSVSDGSDLSANFRLAWDDTNLYFLATVTDQSTQVDSGAQHWNDDSVELYIDANNDDPTTYGADDFQYVFVAGASTAIETQHNPASLTGVSVSGVNTALGYNVEVEVPWTTIGQTPLAGAVIGVEVHVIDDDDGGARDGILSWFGTADTAWQDPSTFGTAQLTCDTTLCPPSRLLGESCASGVECLSGNCADAVCCDAPCTAPCAQCGTNGRCGTAPAGASTGGACTPYLCDGTGTSCSTSCQLDTDCEGTRICTGAGTCVGTLLLGEPCTGSGECSSGFCVSGLCCDQACDGPEMTCFDGPTVGVCHDAATNPAGGCSCNSMTSAAPWWLLMLALIPVRRRVRRR